MKFLTRVLFFLALTGAGSFLLAELVTPLRSSTQAQSPAEVSPAEPIPVVKKEEKTPSAAETSPPSVAAPVTVTEASDGQELTDGKEVLDAKDYKEVLDAKDSKEVIGEGPGRISGPGSLAPGGIQQAVRGVVLPPELPPDTDVVTP